MSRFPIAKCVRARRLHVSSFLSLGAAVAFRSHAQLAEALRRPTAAGAPWHAPMHGASAADALNAGLARGAAEEGAIVAAHLSDALQICQLSPFNTYFTLQALELDSCRRDDMARKDIAS